MRLPSSNGGPVIWVERFCPPWWSHLMAMIQACMPPNDERLYDIWSTTVMYDDLCSVVIEFILPHYPLVRRRLVEAPWRGFQGWDKVITTYVTSHQPSYITVVDRMSKRSSSCDGKQVGMTATRPPWRTSLGWSSMRLRGAWLIAFSTSLPQASRLSNKAKILCFSLSTCNNSSNNAVRFRVVNDLKLKWSSRLTIWWIKMRCRSLKRGLEIGSTRF